MPGFDQKSVNRRRRRFNRPEEIEKSPDIISLPCGTKFDPWRVRVVNESGSKLYRTQFLQLLSYDSEKNQYSVALPSVGEYGLARLRPGELAVPRADINNNAVGYAYIGPILKVRIRSSAENIQVGDSVGYGIYYGRAIKGGPYVCLKASGLYVWIRPNGLL